MKFDRKGFEAYVTDATVESETGVWLAFAGRKFRCLRAGGSNRRFKRVLDQKTVPYVRQIQRGALDPEVDARIMREVYARAVVIDWFGVKDTNGNEISYDPEIAEDYFQQFPELFEDLKTLCANAATFQEGQLEEAKTRLGKPLRGPLDMAKTSSN